MARSTARAAAARREMREAEVRFGRQSGKDTSLGAIAADPCADVACPPFAGRASMTAAVLLGIGVPGEVLGARPPPDTADREVRRPAIRTLEVLIGDPLHDPAARPAEGGRR